jgi:hypothetical protein
MKKLAPILLILESALILLVPSACTKQQAQAVVMATEKESLCIIQTILDDRLSGKDWSAVETDAATKCLGSLLASQDQELALRKVRAAWWIHVSGLELEQKAAMQKACK